VSEIRGLMTVVEMQARDSGQSASPPRDRNPADPFANAWWRASDVFVWTTDWASFRLDGDRRQVVATEVAMKLEPWSASPAGVSATAQAARRRRERKSSRDGTPLP